MNMGTVLRPNGEDSSSTATWLIKLARGDASIMDVMTPQWFVNVQDTARLHVAALLDPTCNGERIFAFAAPFNANDVLAALRKLFPQHKFPDDSPNQGRDITQIPTEDAEALLTKHYGKGFTGLEESIKETFASIKL
jgi:nucleoside-diphosphate-sugar epimerase